MTAPALRPALATSAAPAGDELTLMTTRGDKVWFRSPGPGDAPASGVARLTEPVFIPGVRRSARGARPIPIRT